jgi:3-methylcrotonyl-CoA carboxylase alpha subunit
VLGPATTLPFLADAVAAPAFADGLATTAFITETFPQGWQPPQRHAALAAAAAAVLRVRDVAARTAAALPNGSPWAGLPGFRIVAPARVPLVLAGIPATVLALGGGCWRVEHEQDATPPVTLTLVHTGRAIMVEADGTRLSGHALVEDASITLWLDGEIHAIKVQTALDAAAGAAATGRGSGTLLAPMPGVVAELRVAEGDTVAAGDVLVVLESMTLVMPLAAETDGMVAEIGCRLGETVPAGRVLRW